MQKSVRVHVGNGWGNLIEKPPNSALRQTDTVNKVSFVDVILQIALICIFKNHDQPGAILKNLNH